MSFSNIDGQALGKFLQIAFSDGVRNQISQDYRDWEMIKRVRDGNPAGREVRFLFQNTLGMAAVQPRNPNFTAAFPTGQKSTNLEHTAVYKEIDATVRLEYNLWKRAQLDPTRYAEPLAHEVASKAIASKRRVASYLYGDGSGVIMQVASVDQSALSASSIITVTVANANASRGHIGNAEYGDLLDARALAGTLRSPSGGSNFANWRVRSRSRISNQVVLEAVDANGALVTGYTDSNIVATDVFYTFDQPSIPDLTGSIADWGSASEVIAGLESLTADDGRTIHGIQMSGSTAGTRVSCGGQDIDVRFLQSGLSEVKTRVGEVYDWKQAVMAHETYDAFIESREPDRRFNTLQDATRGTVQFSYQHGNDAIAFVTSEYCPRKRLYVLPEAKGSQDKVLEAHMTDFLPVQAPGSSSAFHLEPSASGGHNRNIVSYMEMYGTLICKHPASILCLEDFTL